MGPCFARERQGQPENPTRCVRPASVRRVGASDPRRETTELDHVTGHQLAPASGLHLAVDADQALDHQLLRVRAGVDQVRELEELAQPDRLVANRYVVHVRLLQSTSETAWMATPTSPPTTVPLMRMNCRSRPTCSSILRAASWPSQRSIVVVMTV